MNINKKRIVIIGGGISGLAAAHRLSELAQEEDKSIEIILLEASGRLGGVIKTETGNGFLMEAGPDAFISEKPWAYELCKRIGLESEIIGTQDQFRRSFIYQNENFIPVPSGFYLIAPSRLKTLFDSRLLSLIGKLRMACEVFIPPRKNPEDESIASFVTRRFGREALLKIGQPMIGGIYMADPERLSLLATLPRFSEMERKYGSIIRALGSENGIGAKQASGPRYSLFLSLNSGMEKLVSTLVRRMSGVQFRTKTEVVQIEQGDCWKIHLKSGELFEADAVCLALPAFESARLIQSLSSDLADRLKNVPYESVATVNLAFRTEDVRRPLNGFGFVVPAFQKKTIAACTLSSIKFAGRAPEGMILFRAFVGGALQRATFDLKDPELTQKVLKELSLALRISSPPLFMSIHRYPRSMPQYQVGHLELVRSIEGRVKNYPGLYLCGNAYRGVGIPDCIGQAENAATEIYGYVTRKNRDEI